MGNISLIALIALLAVVNISALSLRKNSENQFTVKDKVYGNGEMFAEGSAINDCDDQTLERVAKLPLAGADARTRSARAKFEALSSTNEAGASVASGAVTPGA